MRLYLDTCSLQRPLDGKNQLRVVLESEAVLGILARCESGDVAMISSDVLLFEVSRNPNPFRREYAMQALSMAAEHTPFRESQVNRAAELVALGFKPLDALHLAAAEESRSDLCTCDDRLLNKARNSRDLKIQVLSPLDAVGEIKS